MTTKRDLDRLGRAVRRMDAANAKRGEAFDAFAAELDRSQADGMTVREIAKATGLSHNRVSQLVRYSRGQGDHRGKPLE
jgi:transcriptional regulator with XRE-family HTH domain